MWVPTPILSIGIQTGLTNLFTFTCILLPIFSMLQPEASFLNKTFLSSPWLESSSDFPIARTKWYKSLTMYCVWVFFLQSQPTKGSLDTVNNSYPFKSHKLCEHCSLLEYSSYPTLPKKIPFIFHVHVYKCFFIKKKKNTLSWTSYLHPQTHTEYMSIYLYFYNPHNGNFTFLW